MVELIDLKEEFNKTRGAKCFTEKVGGPINSVSIIVRDAEGNIKDERRQNNLLMTIGENYIGDVWYGRSNVYALDTASGMIAVGTGSSLLAAGQSGLGAEVSQESGGRMKIDTITRADVDSGLQLACTFSTSGAIYEGIDEVGLFGVGYATDETTLLTPTYEPDTGALIARAVISGAAITKSDSDEMTVTWEISYAP